MERKLIGGDYVPDGRGGLETLSQEEALLQRVLFRLTARRGQFPAYTSWGGKSPPPARPWPPSTPPRPCGTRRGWRSRAPSWTTQRTGWDS